MNKIQIAAAKRVEDLTRLATAMGLSTMICGNGEAAKVVIPLPNGSAREFEPDRDANDCESLIAWLNKEGYEVDILHWEEGDATVMIKQHLETHGRRYHSEDTIKDWKQAVCELTLKAITDT